MGFLALYYQTYVDRPWCSSNSDQTVKKFESSLHHDAVDANDACDDMTKHG
jgi:hypothetical protein